MTSFSSVQYTSSGTPRTFPQVKKQVHLGKDARSSDVFHFVCFGEETWNCMHFLVILSLKTLWAGVKHWRTALHRFYLYRKPIDHLHDLAIWKWLKNVYISFDLKCICVWCLDNWSRILSGKPFSNFRESWFGFFFIFWDSWPETPFFFIKFSSMEKVFKMPPS